jgi:hypothetical protein
MKKGPSIHAVPKVALRGYWGLEFGGEKGGEGGGEGGEGTEEGITNRYTFVL